MSLTISLVQLERWLATHAPTTLQGLRPGATLDVLDQAAGNMQVRLLPDLRRLWLWHNGSSGNILDGLPLQPGHYFLTTDQAIDEWHSRTEINGGLGNSRSWSSEWIPISTDTAGNHIVVDHGTDGQPGSVFIADIQNGPMRHRGWPSLSEMIDSLRKALEQDEVLDGHRYQATAEGRLAWELRS